MLDQNNINPEAVEESLVQTPENGQTLPTPEVPAVQEVNPAAEQPTIDPSNQVQAQSQIVQNIPQNVVQPTVVAQEPVIQDDTKINDPKDDSWEEKAKTVIKEYADDPYKEEEAEEELQEKYLKERFNVDAEGNK